MTTQPMNIFDADLYGDVRVEDPMDAAGLPFYTYTSPEWYQREVDRIFMRDWIFACRADEIPNVGDYYYFEFVNEPIVIVRGKDGTVRAMSASCRHRGTPVTTESGNCQVFRCPYHSWTYALDGSLLGGPPEMHETHNFDKSQHGLIPIRCETWDGFVYITLDPAQSSLLEYLGDLPEKLAAYNLSDMQVTWKRRYDLECNWKVFVENAMEEYHVATVHLKTIQATVPMDAYAVEEADGEYMSVYGKESRTIALLEGEEGFDWIPTLGEKERGGSHFILTNPNTMYGLTMDTCWWLQILPTGPESCTVNIGACFPTQTIERPDFEEVASRYYRRWETTLAEDNAISELQQKGVRTQVNYRVGRLSHRERLVHTIANLVLDRVLDGGAPAKSAGA